MIDLDSVKHATNSIWALAEWFIVGVVFKFIILKWVADKTKAIFKAIFIRTSHDLAIFLHFRNKAMNKGHAHRQADCDDGQCKFD